jgi:hypothetical protein
MECWKNISDQTNPRLILKKGELKQSLLLGPNREMHQSFSEWLWTLTIYLIIRYFASRQKRQEYNWQQIDIWAFRSSLPTAGRCLLSP